jgi:hypothetical protein
VYRFASRPARQILNVTELEVGNEVKRSQKWTNPSL